MKVNFILKGKNNPTNIFCRFKPTQKNDFTCGTGIFVNREDWNNKKQELKLKSNIKDKDLINDKLKKLTASVQEKWRSDFLNQNEISNKWLQEVVFAFFGKSSENDMHKIYFSDWVDKFISESNKRLFKGKPISNSSIKQYKATLNKIIAFENANQKIRFQNIDLNFYRNFLFYCRNTELLSENSIGGHIKYIKMWCKIIDIEGLPINQQYRSSEFTALSGITKDIYLTNNEINILFNHDFSHNKRLENTRDNFIIGLRTGLRISDFLRLQKTDIQNNFINITTEKTNHTVVIPMHEQVKSILLKNGGEFPPTISDPKFNLYIKEVCKIVGFKELIEGAKMVTKKDDKTFCDDPDSKKNITRKEFGLFPKHELVSSHICRRSFASNLYGKLNNMTIMAITGHKTEAQFLKYIKITPTENAEKLENHWAKQL
jgi:integrase